MSKESKALDLLLRVINTPDVMFVVDGEDSQLASEVEAFLEEIEE